MQLTISLAYIMIASDTVQLLRCLYVNSTKGPAPEHVDNIDSPVGTTSSSQIPLSPARVNGSYSLNDGALHPDQPGQRSFYRRFTDVLKLIFLAATLPGIIGNAKYRRSFDNTGTGKEVMIARYVSSGLALVLIMFVAILTVRARHLPKVRPIHIILILSVLACTAISAIFRLAFMYHYTTSLTSTAPGSGNTPGEKSTFYLFHMLSDWMAAALLLLPNVRGMFATGMWGDWRAMDPPIQELEWARKRNEAKRRAWLNV